VLWNFDLGALAVFLAAAAGVAVASTRLNAVGKKGVVWFGRIPLISALLLVAAYSGIQLIRDLNPELVKDWPWAAIDKMFQAGVVIVFFYAVFGGMSWWIESRSRRADGTYSDLTLLKKVLSVGVLALCVISLLELFGVQLSAVIASLGVVGIALALALQDTLVNYFAGVTLSADKPFEVGDRIALDNEVSGVVESIGWRSTRMKQAEGLFITVPNSKLLSVPVIQKTGAAALFDAVVNGCVAYESQLDHVEQVLIELGTELCKTVEGAKAEIKPVVRFQKFADGNIQFVVRMKCESAASADQLAHEYYKAMHRTFFELGVPVNFPMRMPPPMSASEEHAPPRDVI